MKGLALKTVMLLIIALIVIFLALFFLSLIPSLDQDSTSGDLLVLSKYSTCSLAYCASGGGSDQVKKVGCLQSENGRCLKSCEDVEEKDFKGIGKSFEIGGVNHYCGKDYAIPFEFSGVGLSGGTVLVRSGQLDKISKNPGWICKSASLPFAPGIEIDEAGRYLPIPAIAKLTTADAQYTGNFIGVFEFPKNCIMLSKSVTDSATYANTITFAVNFIPFAGQAVTGVKSAIFAIKTFGAKSVLVKASRSTIQAIKNRKVGLSTPLVGETASGLAMSFLVGESNLNDPHRSRGMLTKGGCFTGYVYDYMDDDLPPREDILYTPIIQYDSSRPETKVYPSAIYVDQTFLTSLDGTSPPECEYDNQDLVDLKAEISSGTATMDDLREKFKAEFKEANKDNPDYKLSSYDTSKSSATSGNVNTPVGPINPAEIEITQDLLDDILEADAQDYAERKLGKGSISGIDVYGTGGLSTTNSFDFGNMVKGCKLKSTYDGKKITYKVWSNPTYPGIGTLRGLGEFGKGLAADQDAVLGGIFDLLSSDKSEDVRKAASGDEFKVFLRESNDVQNSINIIKTEFEKLVAYKIILDSSKDENEKTEYRNLIEDSKEKIKLHVVDLDKAVDKYVESDDKRRPEADSIKKALKDKVGEILKWIDESKDLENKDLVKKKIDELDVSINEKIPDIVDGGRGWMSQFGSCAFVTLGRDLPGYTPTETTTPVGSITVGMQAPDGFEKTTFEAGEVAVFAGQVKNPSDGGGSSVWITIEKLNPVYVILPTSTYQHTATVDNDGKFKIEYQIGSEKSDEVEKYLVKAHYTGMTAAEARFEVS